MVKDKFLNLFDEVDIIGDIKANIKNAVKDEIYVTIGKVVIKGVKFIITRTV